MAKPGISGRPRSGLPFIERRESGAFLYRRKVPVDLVPVLGEAWVHRFPPGVAEQTVKEVSAALARYHDEQIAERRARLKGIHLAGAM